MILKAAVKQVTKQMAKEGKTASEVKDYASKLACTMRYIRAVERGDWRCAAAARAAFPEIGTKVGGHGDKELRSRNFEGVVHAWILELAKGTVTEEIEEVRRMQAEGDECGVKRGKESIIRKLKRIHGGTTGAIRAMRSENGDVGPTPRG